MGTAASGPPANTEVHRPPFEDCFFSGIVPVHFNVSGVRGTKLRGQTHVVSPAWLPLTENTPGVSNCVGGRGKRNRHLCCLPLRKMQVASVDKKLFAPQFAGKEAPLAVNVAIQRAHKMIVASQGFNWTKNKRLVGGGSVEELRAIGVLADHRLAPPPRPQCFFSCRKA